MSSPSLPTADHQPFTVAPAAYLPRMLAFLTEIGILVREEPFSTPSFLPGILIDKGELIIDHAQLLYPGDVLHEAGHIAVTVAAERHLLQANVTENHPEKDGEELAVLLWTYAACQVLGIPEEVVFHPAGYKDQSEWLIENFRGGVYIGLPLLVWMGLTTAAGFPAMTHWLRA